MDRVGLLHQLATLPEHPESVPINALVAVKGTPLQVSPCAPTLGTIDIDREISANDAQSALHGFDAERLGLKEGVGDPRIVSSETSALAESSAPIRTGHRPMYCYCPHHHASQRGASECRTPQLQPQ